MATRLYRIYQICIGIPIGIILTILTALTTTVGCVLGNASFWGYHPGRIWSRLVCAVLLIPVHVTRHPDVTRDTSYIFVANHQGAFDIFLIYGFLGRNFKWMMKKALEKIPFVGRACRNAGFIFVDKSGPKKIQETIDQARHTLKDGMSLVVFPEGSRSKTGHLANFKKGAFQLADELQLPIVPLTIEGSYEVLPRSRSFIRRHSMSLTMHTPIYPKGQGPDNLRQTLQSAYEVIADSLAERYKPIK